MRTFTTALLALVLLLLQSALGEVLPRWLPAPALGVLVVLHIGLSPRWSLIGQVLFAFATGYLFDLVSGAPRGTHALIYTLLVLLVGRLAPRVSVRGFLLRTGVSFAAALLAAVAAVTIRALISQIGGFSGAGRIPVEATVTALLGPAVLSLFERLEGRHEGQRARQLRPRGGLPLG